MKYINKFLCLALAAVMLLGVLTACGDENNRNDPAGTERPPAVAPNANGELTFGDQTFSVDTERLTVNLQLRSNEVLDLSPLEWCTQLRYLSVNLTVIPHLYYDKFDDPHIAEMEPTDLSPLGKLTGLERLELNVGRIDDLSVLAALPNLSTLVLWIDGELDLTPLAGCPALTELSLGGRGTVELAPLTRCVGLNNLRIDVYDRDWNAPDLSALSGAPALGTLSIGASNGLSELTNVPLCRLVDLNDSGNILENLPDINSLEYVEFSDEHLNDILPLLQHPGITQITLEVGAQEIENFTVINSPNDPALDSLITVIPVAQLREFLVQNGASITLVVDRNRTAGVME